MSRSLALLITALAVTSHTLDVGAGTVADFKAWAVDEPSRSALQAPLPSLLEILPGMTQISARIDPAVREAVAKFLRDFPKGKVALTHDEFAARWSSIEPDLASVATIPEAVEVVEAAGRRMIEELSLKQGLCKSAEAIKGAEASTFYAWNDAQRQQWLSAIGWRIDSKLNQTIMNHMNQRAWSRKLNETQKTKISHFILMLNKEGVTEKDAELNMSEIWLQFKKKNGSSMPEFKDILDLLRASKVLKK